MDQTTSVIEDLKILNLELETKLKSSLTNMIIEDRTSAGTSIQGAVNRYSAEIAGLFNGEWIEK